MWKDGYLVGNELIDNQHKELFVIIRNLLLTLKDASDKAEYKKSLIDAIVFLKGYVVQHFTDEENYMENKNFKGLELHKRFHEELTNDVLFYEKQLVDSDFSIPIVKKFLGFVNVWLIQHVAGEDQQFSDNYIQKEISNDIVSQTCDVIKMMTNYDPGDVTVYRENYMPEGSNLCFRVGLSGDIKKAIGLVFSDRFTAAVFKAMTSMDLVEQDEFVVSAMSEIGNMIAGRIAPIVGGKPSVAAETPVQTDAGAFPAEREVTYLRTAIGDVAVLVFGA